MAQLLGNSVYTDVVLGNAVLLWRQVVNIGFQGCDLRQNTRLAKSLGIDLNVNY